jgi:hypothetical protein
MSHTSKQPGLSGTELLGRLTHEAQQDLADGEAATGHLKGANAELVAQWHRIGKASVTLRNSAMHLAGTNDAVGKRYNQIWKALADTKPGLRDLDKRNRAHAMWLADNWPAVNAWLLALTEPDRLRLNHPTSIMRRYEAAHTPPSQPGKTAAPQTSNVQTIIRLQEENDLLRKKGGGGLMPSARVEDVVESIFAAHNPVFVKKLIVELDKRLAAEQRQEAIEAKAAAAAAKRKKA